MDGDRQENGSDEKSVIGKMVDRVSEAVENIVNTASAAAMQAMEQQPSKATEQPITPVLLAGDGLLSDPLPAMPPVAVAPAARKRPSPNKAAKKAAKKSPRKTVGKTAKRTAKKSVTKAAKKTIKKTARKKSKARKSKR